MQAPRLGTTQEELLRLLKTRGPQSAAALAATLGLTAMGVRQHLSQLQEAGIVAYAERRGGVGRPSRLWNLTPAGHARFPQEYAALTAELLAALRRAFGAQGIKNLLEQRTRAQRQQYSRRLPRPPAALPQRVAALAKVRRHEGYMATWSRQPDGSFTLVENHCPIAVAAQLCPGLCDSELELFRTVLGRDVAVERDEHLLAGARRCTYRIAPRRRTGAVTKG